MKTEFDPHDQPIDPQLAELLEQLRESPPRDPGAVERGRAKFLAEIESIRPTRKTRRSPLSGLFSRNHQHTEDVPMRRKPRFALSLLIVSLLGFVFLLYGAGATVSAAQAALPGDALYTVKTGLEQTRLVLAGDAYDRAQLHLEFAQRRLDEMADLIAEGRFPDVSRAAEGFEADVQKAIEAFQVVAANDPSRAGDLAIQIADALSRYAQVLGAMVSSVPEAVRPEVERALLFTMNRPDIEFTGFVEAISADAWTIGGHTVLVNPQTEIRDHVEVGDFVKVRALLGSSNSLVALRIESDDDPENENANANENENDNANANENGDDNENGNENDNENENANANENGDDNENENENGNDNANANENMNENDNANENENENENGDDNENENGNGNDNGNENTNANENGNENANENENANTNENGNENANENGNENDNDNGNANDNDNQNDNEGDDQGNDNANGNDNGGGGGGGNDNGNDND